MGETHDDEKPIAEVFAEIVKLAERRGVKRICDLPGCWEVDLGGGWWFALNGHNVATKSSRGANVLPFHAYAERHELPAMLLSPYDGVRLGGEAMEDDLLAALRAAPGGA